MADVDDPRFEVRRFDTGDGERVRELDEVAMAETPEWIPEAPDEDLHDVPGHYLDSGGEFLVGVLDGKIVTTAAYEPLHWWMAETFGDGDRKWEAIDGNDSNETGGSTVEVSRMRVDPDHWGQGYGTRIYDELEARARADGRRGFVLNTGVENDRARGFYEARGFEHVRNERLTVDEFTLHLALYRKRILE